MSKAIQMSWFTKHSFQSLIFVLVFLLLLIQDAAGRSLVIMKGSMDIEHGVNGIDETVVKSFMKWFQCPANHLKIIRVNPAYEHVDLISKNLFRIKLKSISCPGIKIQQYMDYDLVQNETSLILTARSTSLKQICTGSKLMCNVFKCVSTPSTINSQCVISINPSIIKHMNSLTSYDESSNKTISSRSYNLNNLLKNITNGSNNKYNLLLRKTEYVEVHNIFINVYVPGLPHKISLSGSSSIQKSLNINVKRHLENIFLLYTKENDDKKIDKIYKQNKRRIAEFKQNFKSGFSLISNKLQRRPRGHF